MEPAAGDGISGGEANPPPVTVVFHGRGRRQSLVVEREGFELRLKLLSAESDEWQGRMDLRDPGRLIVPYMRAMVLSLLWRPEPARIHLLGLGTGRIPAFLRHHCPQLSLEVSEIDPDVADLAGRYFGLRADERLRIFLGDGREVLEHHAGPGLYDAILVDAFCGVGGAPLHLSSREFLALCRSRLRPDGVCALNLIPGDPLQEDRLGAVAAAFPSVHLLQDEDSLVAFGSEATLDRKELMARAESLQPRHRFGFSLITGARSLAPLPRRERGMITDTTPAERLVVPAQLWPAIRPADPCPCGSGRDFASCHRSDGRGRRRQAGRKSSTSAPRTPPSAARP